MSSVSPESQTNEPSSPQDHSIDDGELMARIGGHPGEAILAMFRAAHLQQVAQSLRARVGHIELPFSHSRERPKTDPVSFAKSFIAATHFEELDKDLVIQKDTVGFERVVDGQVVTYDDSTERARTRCQNEAVSYGTGKLNKHDFVGIIFNWDFMGASIGDVAAEKIIKAFDLAKASNKPVVILYCSGGQRQQEGLAALWGMDKVVHVINQYQGATVKPDEINHRSITAVITHDTMGGATASGLPRADEIIGMAGAKKGFAGGRLIEGHTGEKVGENEQSVETNFLTNKSVHMILHNLDELLQVLNGVFAATFRDDLGRVRKHPEINGFDFTGEGFRTPFMPIKISDRTPRAQFQTRTQLASAEDIYEQYQILAADARRPDLLYILRHSFDAYTPLFSERVIRTPSQEEEEVRIEPPAIVAAFAAIKDVKLPKTLWFLVVGNQPSYVRNKDGVILKDHASPGAWDYRRLTKILETGDRLGFPLVSLIGTFGANPSIKEELNGLNEFMSDAASIKLKYRHLSIGVILAMLGSGGGGAAYPWDKRLMLRKAQGYVAVPPAAVEILYKNPQREDVMRTARTMRPDAQFLYDTHQIDGMVVEPEEGAGLKPLETALAVRESIIATWRELGHLTPAEIEAIRDAKIRGTKPLPMGYLSGQAPDHKSLIRRLLRRR